MSENIDKFDYKNITPFKWFVLQNFPFIEADFDALTNWQLFCKLGQEMNKIINSVNDCGNQVENLTTAYINLENFVNNYFSDLNLQSQVDNKLDAMAEDGTLAEIINQEIFGEIQENIETLQGDVSDINDSISGITDDISGITDDISGITDDISGITDDISGITDDISGINDDISGINDDISGINDDISGIDTNITNINQRLNDVKSSFNVCRGIAHRGLSAEAPENTIPAIVKAGMHNCFGVEIDIQTTFDNEIILMHDTNVDRMTNGTGNVNDLTYTYINSLTIDSGKNVSFYTGLKVPKLEQALEKCRLYNLNCMMELKGVWTTNNLQKLVSLLKYYGMYENCSIISFDTTQLDNIRTFDTTIPLAILTGSELSSGLVDKAISLGNCMISMDYTYNTTLPYLMIQSLKDNNIKFGFWTVNDDTIARSLISYNPRYIFYSR